MPPMTIEEECSYIRTSPIINWGGDAAEEFRARYNTLGCEAWCGPLERDFEGPTFELACTGQ
jgi:hypothetical protein